MKATIVPESKGRMRLRLGQKQMSMEEADLMEAWLQRKPWVREATVHERTCCVILYYCGTREQVIEAISSFSYQEARQSVPLPVHSSRQLNREFEERLVGKIIRKAFFTLFLPLPLRIARVVWHMLPFLRKGLHCRCTVRSKWSCWMRCPSEFPYSAGILAPRGR